MLQNPRPPSSFALSVFRFLGRLSPLDCFQEKRFWRYALLPLAGSILPVLVLAIHKGNPMSESLVGLVSAVARALPVVLLIRMLDRDPAGPFRLRVSWTALAVCFVGFSGPILIGARSAAWYGAMQSAVYPLLLTGVLAGIVSAVPARGTRPPGCPPPDAPRGLPSSAFCPTSIVPCSHRSGGFSTRFRSP